MKPTINTNPGILDDWTSYLFPSPSKATPASPTQVTCVEFYRVPHCNTTLLLQATPGTFSVFDAHTKQPIGRKHPTEGDYVRLARFLPSTYKQKLPNVLLLTTKLSVYSLEEESYVLDITFPVPIKEILDIQTNAHVVAVLTHHTIRLLDPARDFVVTHIIATTSDAVALGSRWLAFPSAAASTPPKPSVDELSLTDVAQGFASGLYYLSKVARKGSSSVDTTNGTAVVIDCVNQSKIAELASHSSPITYLAFDPSGQLLVTASAKGQTLHVHRVHDQALLYRLQRGITHARIRRIVLSTDVHWAAVSTFRGTTHIYALRPQGGAVGGHTHAPLNLNNPVQLQAAQAAMAHEQQTRAFGRQTPPPETVNALARLRHEEAVVLACHWEGHSLLVATGGELQEIALRPEAVILPDKEALGLRLDVEVAQNTPLDTTAAPTTFLPVSVPLKLGAVETSTHHASSLPLWLHPKVTFRADGRALSVKRLGPVPLSTEDTNTTDSRTQGASPVFNGSFSDDEPLVPLLDLSASISHAVATTLEIEPFQKRQVMNGQPPPVIQDAYFEQ
ncbi:hypothetical protein LEN26_011215 [Aphanomyces euteiches]|nr:hypothetical protein LEN26_011215 [Aphanomyces euteiches]